MNRPSGHIIYFDPELLGRSLKQMNTKQIRTDSQDVTSSWYHSERDVDLFIWRDERANIIKQQLVFLGQIVEWNIIEGTRTGVLVEEGPTEEEMKPHIQFDESRQSMTVGQVVEILRAIAVMPALEREQLIKNFSESPNFADLHPEQVLSLYGRPNTWRNRLMAWLDRLVFLFHFGRRR